MSNAVKMSVDEMIRHYQRSIERSQQDPKRVLHCLNKLHRMDVTVQHLQATGIGRTVNALRKDDGEVGSLSRALILKWKQMVAAESSDYSEEGKLPDEPDSQEEIMESPPPASTKSQRHHDHNSSRSKSDNHNREHSKHTSRSNSDQNKNHSSHRKYSIESTQENSMSAEPKAKRSHESERTEQKHSSHRSKDERHRSSDKHADGERNEKKHKHSSGGQHRKTNEPNQVSSSSNSHKRHRDDDSEHPSGSTKRQKCDSTTSPTSHVKEKKTSKTKHKTADDGIEIDHSMGTSFADALGMIEPMAFSTKASTSSSSTSGKSKSSMSEQISTSSREKTSSSSNKSKHKIKSEPSTSTSSNSSKPMPAPTPSLLTGKAKLPPLALDLSRDLPQAECIIPNDYKPMPVNSMVMDLVYRQPAKPAYINDTDALCASTTSKNIRTKVYSGVKSGTIIPVPSLHELCIRFLQKNIDALEYTGGVPFEILRPILERATPGQLYTFEHYNPYMMTDSDVLWEQHCKHKFRRGKREEMERWREMYMRCQQEQEDRLNSLTNNIKRSQSVAVPVRQTKLAYVDSAVNPPRSIVKKQHQFGTQNKLIATPAARTEALSSLAPNIARIGDVRLRTTQAMRDTAQATVSNGIKPKKAPLMMKTLQLMKGRFKR